MAVAQYNAERYWDCHETLESDWLEAEGEEKRFIQGVIQIAAACVHIQNKNLKGAQSLMQKGLTKIEETVALLDKTETQLNLALWLRAVQILNTQLQQGNWGDIPLIHGKSLS
jgi:predicted metal-dependent hydrolase